MLISVVLFICVAFVFGSKELDTLEKIFGHEGSCQNWSSDSGNYIDGKLGYTCMGVTPSVGWDNRQKYFSYATSSFSGSPELFVKHAYDRSLSSFKNGAAQLYTDKYFYVCTELRQPAFYVCSDVSVNSGPGRSSGFKRELASESSSWKLDAYATAFNEKHREFYKKIAPPGSSNYQFLNGWLARADSRDSYISSYCRSSNCKVSPFEGSSGSRNTAVIVGAIVGPASGLAVGSAASASASASASGDAAGGDLGAGLLDEIEDVPDDPFATQIPGEGVAVSEI